MAAMADSEAVTYVYVDMEEQLGEAVRSYPVLYDKTLKEFKDKTMRENAWAAVANAVQEYNQVSMISLRNFIRGSILLASLSYSRCRTAWLNAESL